MPGRRSTVGRMPHASAARKCGKKLSSPKRKGTASGGEQMIAFDPRSSRDGAIVNAGAGRCAARSCVISAGSDERNVAGHGQHAGTPLRGEEPCRRRNRSAVPVAGAYLDDARAIARRQPACRRVDGHDRQPAETRRRGERRQYILEHRQHQRPPPLGRQHRRQPFLGPIQLLDRHDRPHAHFKHRGRPLPAPPSPSLHDPRWSTSTCAPTSREYRGLRPHSHPPRRR